MVKDKNQWDNWTTGELFEYCITSGLIPPESHLDEFLQDRKLLIHLVNNDLEQDKE